VTKHLIGPAAAGTAQLRAWESIFRWGTAFDDLERDLGIDGRHLTRDQIAEAWASFGAQFMPTWTPKRYAEWPWAYREFGDPR
jgi:hypothetical protein